MHSSSIWLTMTPELKAAHGELDECKILVNADQACFLDVQAQSGFFMFPEAGADSSPLIKLRYDKSKIAFSAQLCSCHIIFAVDPSTSRSWAAHYDGRHRLYETSYDHKNGSYTKPAYSDFDPTKPYEDKKLHLKENESANFFVICSERFSSEAIQQRIQKNPVRLKKILELNEDEECSSGRFDEKVFRNKLGNRVKNLTVIEPRRNAEIEEVLKGNGIENTRSALLDVSFYPLEGRLLITTKHKSKAVALFDKALPEMMLTFSKKSAEIKESASALVARMKQSASFGEEVRLDGKNERDKKTGLF